MVKKLIVIILSLAMMALCGCGTAQSGSTSAGSSAQEAGTQTNAEKALAHRYASAEEGKDLLMGKTAYYDGFSQNDLEFRMQKKGATMDEYKTFAEKQAMDFTEKEQALIDEYFDKMAKTLEEKGYTLPPLEEIVLVKTTMAEECDAGGYTHGTQIYMSQLLLEYCLEDPKDESYRERLEVILWHELFHCLTRCNPEFRADMYKLIHFTVGEKDYKIPESVFEYHISNPDVEHHDSYATFKIDGRDVDCFCDFVTTKHFEKEGDNFFDCGTTALVPVDGSDTYYTPKQAKNFDEVFGTNTDYVIDPEECMADNFAYAMIYGMDGPEGKGYPNPEIIEGIIKYLSK